MANQIHRNLTQGELHRPERTGSGSPIGQSFSFLEDGQYYQDTLTGSLWRYSATLATWEQLIQYDRSTGKVTNVTTGVAVQATKLGITTAAINAGTITTIPARLFTQVRKGEDLKIISTASDDVVISVTVNADTGSGYQNIPVQSVNTEFTFPENSSIVLESGLQGAYDSVDPTKIESKLQGEHEGDSVGMINTRIVPSGLGGPTLTNVGIDAQGTVRLRDGQRLMIVNPSGFFEYITVNGAQTLEEGDNNLTIEPFTPKYGYIPGRSYVKEPSYVSTTRVTQTENSIELQAQSITDLSTFTSTLNIAVNQNAAEIDLLAQAQDGQNVTIAGLEANATAQQATLVLLAEAQAGQNSAISTLEANATSQQATLALITQAQSGQNSAIATLEANATAQQATLELLAQARDGQNTAISSLELNATSQQATLSLLSQAQDGQNLAIAAINANATAQQATLTLLAQARDGQNSAISLLEANATSQQATLALLAQARDGQNTAISSLQLNATAQQATLSLLAQANDGQNSAIAAINANATAQQATLSLLTQAQAGQNSAISSLELNATAQQSTILLLSQARDGQNVAISSLETNATAQQATLALLAQARDGQNTAISSLQLNATAQQATLSLLAQAENGQNAAIAAINANATAQQATLTLLAQARDGQNASISLLEANATAQQATLTLLAQARDGQNTSIASLVANASAQQATLNSSVQYNEAVGYIQLLAGPAGSEITLQADQINVDGIVNFINDTEGITTIDGDKITTGSITASQINTDALFAESITSTNTITIGATGKITNGDSDFELSANGLALQAFSGSVQGDEPTAIKWGSDSYIIGTITDTAPQRESLVLSSESIFISGNNDAGADVVITGDLDVDGTISTSNFSAGQQFASITSQLLTISDTEVNGDIDVFGGIEATGNVQAGNFVSADGSLGLTKEYPNEIVIEDVQGTLHYLTFKNGILTDYQTV